jgi:hypothetical protein
MYETERATYDSIVERVKTATIELNRKSKGPDPAETIREAINVRNQALKDLQLLRGKISNFSKYASKQTESEKNDLLQDIHNIYGTIESERNSLERSLFTLESKP